MQCSDFQSLMKFLKHIEEEGADPMDWTHRFKYMKEMFLLYFVKLLRSINFL